MAEATPHVEILVHITAASRAADDARYRSLASSYIDFEPAKQTPWPVSPQKLAPPASLSQSQNVDPLQASFGSVIDNANSPRLRHAVGDTPLTPNAHHHATVSPSPSSVVQDSHADNHVALAAYTSPTRLLEHYLQNLENSSFSESTDNGTQQSTGQSTGRVVHGTPVPAVPISAVLGGRAGTKNAIPPVPYSPPPIVPCTPAGTTAPPTVVPVNKEVEPNLKSSVPEDSTTDDQVIDETIFISSSDEPAQQQRANSEPLLVAHQHSVDLSSSTSLEDGPRGLLRTTSDLGPVPLSELAQTLPTSSAASTLRRPLNITFLRAHGYTYESLELCSPDPPVSALNIDAEDLVTPSLAKLAVDLDIDRRFQPEESSRALRPTERGYWLLDCSTWDAQLRREAWAFLANYVGTNVAGWGVWCRRDEDFRWLRAYCWGAVVPHMYLVLYLASQRRVLYTGAVWVDGEGQTVIQMGVRAAQ